MLYVISLTEIAPNQNNHEVVQCVDLLNCTLVFLIPLFAGGPWIHPSGMISGHCLFLKQAFHATYNQVHYWNKNAIILLKFLSLTAVEVVILFCFSISVIMTL